MEQDTLSEKPNSDWKSRLNNADELSAEILPDKNATWEKLHTRLREKPRHRKVVWYWLAAAVLLSAVFIPLKFAGKRENSMVKNNIIKTSITSPLYKEKQLKENITAVIPSVINEKKKITKIIASSKINDIHNEELLHVKNEEILAGHIDSLSPVINNPVITFATLLPKKKLKVIHINELGDPVEESPEVAHNIETHSFQIKIASQEVYENHIVTSNAAGFNFFKPKSSPN